MSKPVKTDEQKIEEIVSSIFGDIEKEFEKTHEEKIEMVKDAIVEAATNLFQDCIQVGEPTVDGKRIDVKFTMPDNIWNRLHKHFLEDCD